METLFKITFFFLFINSVVTQPVTLSSESERGALLDLRLSLGIRARYWPRRADPCLNWTGIECQNGQVVGINLSGLRRTRVGLLNPSFSVDSLVNLTALSSFNSSAFSLPGTIPEWFGQRMASLRVLDLRSCSIFGSIPGSLGRLNKLSSLWLSRNSITGNIPASLSELFSLSILDLSENLLTGPVPTSLAALRNLSTLDLSSNLLSGPIPIELGLLSGLGILNLSNNTLSGPVPSQLGNLSRLAELDIGHNSLSGSFPELLGELSSLRKMVVGNNALQGKLPSRLFANASALEYLVLSLNHFDGELPEALWSMSQIKFLDVSENNFTGVFPSIAAAFNASGAVFNFSKNSFYGNLIFRSSNFRSVDLSDNYFEGIAPNISDSSISIANNCFSGVQSQRNPEDCRKFYLDRGLEFGNNNASRPIQPSAPQTRKSRRLTYIMIGVFGGIGFFMLLVPALLLLKKSFKRNQRETANVAPVVEGENKSATKDSINLSSLGHSFAYDQMLQATNNFSSTNLIKQGHSGDLFQGILENGCNVVIKRVDLNRFNEESYMLELDCLSKTSHPRLVPFLGHCLDPDDQKLMVYKYMPHGDLSSSLYKDMNVEDNGLPSLDWITRLKIAIGAAEALSYLHHDCYPPLVHGDMQASSILLDDKYEVRLGSLSRVCAQEGDSCQNSITKLLRVPQTSAKNHAGPASLTCAYDVYCFGKVLLELVTGELGISKSNDISTKEWLEKILPYISVEEKELVAKIVDTSLIIDDDLLEEVWAVAIVAKSCLNPKPSRRPLMRHILRALENPFKVVREENISSGTLRKNSSRNSWTAAFFGSWRHSSSDSNNAQGQMAREGISGVKPWGRLGSQGSFANSSSHRRISSEIFPEPVEVQDLERQE